MRSTGEDDEPRDPFPSEADTLTTHVLGTLADNDPAMKQALPARPRPPLAPPPLPRRRPKLDDTITTTAHEADLEDSTTPTIALSNRSDSAREVYRRFLASEYAPALTLANELLAQGDQDPMLLTIARECQVSLRRIDGGTTLAQIAAMSGLGLDEVVEVVERLMLGPRTIRSNRPPV